MSLVGQKIISVTATKGGGEQAAALLREAIDREQPSRIVAITQSVSPNAGGALHHVTITAVIETA